MLMPFKDPYVSRVVSRMSDPDLLQLIDRAYCKLQDPPTLDYPPNAARLRDLFPTLQGARWAVFETLREYRPHAIIDGAHATSLMDGMRAETSPTGIEILAATEKRGRDENNDRIALHTGIDFAAVIDGMGHGIGPGKAARILAEELLERPHRTNTAAELARARMETELQGKGACFASARLELEINNTWTLDRDRKGDCRVSIIDPLCSVISETEDQSSGPQPTNAVHAYWQMPHENFPPVTNLSPGTIIMLTSDGVHKIVSPREFAETMLRPEMGNVERALEKLSKVLTERGYDNTSIVLMRIPRDPSTGSG